MEYIFGKNPLRPDLKEIAWDPDGNNSINSHMLITGGSGSGKTTLITDIVRELAESGKHIFIFDLKGDMIIKDKRGDKIGNYIEFTAWDSKYGINPFEFDTGVTTEELKKIIETKEISKEQDFKLKNSGPKVQVERIIEIIKKNYLPNMGTNQKDILMYLFKDTYLMNGFKHNDVDTWLNDLPNLKDTLELIHKIKEHHNNPGGVTLDSDSENFIFDLKKSILAIKKEINSQRVLDGNDSQEDYDSKKIEDANFKTHFTSSENKSSNDNTVKIEKEIIEKLSKYVEKQVKTISDSDFNDNATWFKKHDIDIDKYTSKDAIRTLDKISSYINAMVEAEVFHSKRPPVKNGLNIINISGLDVIVQRFIVDIWLGKVFRSCKIKGDYKDRTNKSRGAKCDTFVVIDESKLIAGTSREKNDPYSYLNRIATEARGFGLGLLVAAQSAEHFPPEFLKNFYSQIILNTSIADFDTVRKSFGVSKELLETTQKGWGNALIKVGNQFMRVKLTEKY